MPMQAWRKQMFRRRPSEVGPWLPAPEADARELWELITASNWRRIDVLPGGRHVFRGGRRPDRVTLLIDTFGETDIPYRWDNVTTATAIFIDREYAMAWDFRATPSDDWLLDLIRRG